MQEDESPPKYQDLSKTMDKITNSKLQQRLYDKGFNLGTMPSVQRPLTLQSKDKPLTAKLNSYKSRVNKLEPIIYQHQSIILHKKGVRGASEKLSQGIIKEEEEFEGNQEQEQNSNRGHSQKAISQLQTLQSGNKQHQDQNNIRVESAPMNTLGQLGLRGITRGEDAIDLHPLIFKTSQMFSTGMIQKVQLPPMSTELQGSGLFGKNKLGLTQTGFSDVEMRRTKFLVDKISGKFNIDQRYTNTAQMNKTGVNFGSRKKMLNQIEQGINNEEEGQPAPQEQQHEQQGQQENWEEAQDLLAASKRPPSKLDKYIDLILKNVTNVDEFIYLRRPKKKADEKKTEGEEKAALNNTQKKKKKVKNKMEKAQKKDDDLNKDEDDPYNLKVVDYDIIKEEEENGELREYFTISKKGLCHYVNGKPIEFIQLAYWLKERETYDQIKSLKFFTKFRKWKTLKMWRKNVIKHKTKTCSEALEEKLFVLNPILRNTLIKFRSNTFEMQESLRFIGLEQSKYTDTEATYTLETFRELQEATRNKITDQIQEYSKNCRKIVKDGFTDCLDLLKKSQKISQNDEDLAGQKKQNQNVYRMKESAYENLGFSDNMNYENRSELRKECSKFIRFSYLVDFLAMESLSNIFMLSVQELQTKLETLVDEDVEVILANGQQKPQNSIEPLFQVFVTPFFDQIEEENVDLVELKEFIPPPFGNSTVDDFNPLYHVHLQQVREEAAEEETGDPEKKEEAAVVQAYDENKVYSRRIVPSITELWLKTNPDREAFFKELMKFIAEGAKSIQTFERWSKHDDMNQYSTVLEEWDDMVGDEWSNPESNVLNPLEWLESTPNELFSAQFKQIIERAFFKCDSFIRNKFHEYLMTYWENLQIEVDIFQDETLENPADSFSFTLKMLSNQKDFFEKNIPISADLGLLRVDTSNLRKQLVPQPNDVLKKFQIFMPSMISKRNEEVRIWMAQSANSLKGQAPNIDEFVRRSNILKQIQNQLESYKQKFSILNNLHEIMNLYKFEMKKDDVAQINETRQIEKRLESAIMAAEEAGERNLERYAKDVTSTLIPELERHVVAVDSKVQDQKYLQQETKVEQAIANLGELDQECKKLEEKAKTYRHYQLTLKLEVSRFENLENMRTDLNLRSMMWTSLKEWKELTSKWIEGKFLDIDTEEIRKEGEKHQRVTNRCNKNLPANPVLKELTGLVHEFKDTMPVVLALRNKYLKDYHWVEIKRIIGREFEITDTFKLRDLMEMDVVSKMEEIQEVSTQATQEFVLEGQYNELKEKWMKAEMQFKPHSNKSQKKEVQVNLLGGIDDLNTLLDELLANLNTILGSRYLKKLRDDVSNLQKQVLLAQSFFDDWINVQRNWIYLENIFASADIRNRLPQDSHLFDSVDTFFKKKLTEPACKGRFINKIVKDILAQQLAEKKNALNSIQKSLDNLLEEKRNAFPRFYFLSNDELLEILAKANDMEAIQKNLKKCFDAIHRLDFGEEGSKSIQGMISPEGEKIKFASPMFPKGEVEVWLRVVQDKMRDSLQKLTKKGKLDDQKERQIWVLDHCAQIVATVSQIQWCGSTEYFIAQMAENDQSLSEWFGVNITQLEQLTKLVTSGLKSIQHKSIVALITQDVHARDIVKEMMDAEVSNVNDFIWQKQLRYYWEDDNGNETVIVRQVNSTIRYGFEYMGATSRLVITPLTDRCWMTITGALNIQLGCAPAGPAGTGKTESTKDLAKALGMFCVVFNCSEQIEYKMMGRLFCGLAQQGAWACLDEFNRIDIEVLSVIAQQLLTIRQALVKGEARFLFIDKEIDLQADGYGVFITMNPGYAGRTELPDNLKVLFRPVSMMIPDYRLIAEIMLFAEGFRNAEPLSHKMRQLYKLSSEQLSQQDHYDFGMRAVKSVLVMAGTLKRSQPDMEEDIVLIRAMRDSNIPKFLKHDLPLFQALIQDLFPSVKIPDPDYKELPNQIDASCERLGYQKVANLQTKIIQLFETFNVRFGVMIVGATTSGKTACFEVLKDSMTELRKKECPDQRFQEVWTHILNPKSITMGELYGKVDPNTQEWEDGLASDIMRTAAGDETQTRQWVVFDGPVDALWIENMNTVLDDNMMLCLANGQRIKLRNEMRMLFEVMDLRVASPATVSRCGMVYLMYEDLGWRPYVVSWIQRVFGPKVNEHGEEVEKEKVPIEFRKHIHQLFEDAVDPILHKIRVSMKEPIVTCDLQLVTSLCNLLECFMDEHFGWKKAEKPEQKKRFINYVFAYSFVWSFSSTVYEVHHKELENLIRDRLPNVLFPNNDMVMGYFLDNQGTDLGFKHWNELTPAFVYDKEIPYFNLLVPTVDTTRFSFFIEQLLIHKKNVYVTGSSGTGKSVVIQQLLTSIQHKRSLDSFPFIFSAQTDSKDTQLAIENKLEKIKKNLMGAKAGRTSAIFVDDINMPAVEVYGAQPPIELLRLLVDKGGVYDRRERFWKSVINTVLVCCSAPPGGGRNNITLRFTRHFNMLNFPQPTPSILNKIFDSLLSGFFNEGFQDSVKRMTAPIVDGTIEVYTRICTEKLPIPSKFHYTFNLRDVSKVFQGIMMCTPSVIRDDPQVTRLWIHEVSRVFHDRLINDIDKDWFKDLIAEILGRQFRSRWTKDDVFDANEILFSDLLRLESGREYEDIKDMKKLLKVLGDKLEEYNYDHPTKMNLVFFDQCVQHILRISRVLRSPRGNSMLIGVGGSGKQSLTKLSSYIMNFDVMMVSITKGYGTQHFRDFIKTMMIETGREGKGVTFLFTDTQILQESFVEDINNILNSGEVPNLWDVNEKDENIRAASKYNSLLKRPEDPDTIYRTFVERVRNNLHIVLCMSPVGDALRVRCRKFPSLVDCCALNWFSSWPAEALISVAKKIISDDLQFPTSTSIAKDALEEAIADMCKEVHQQSTEQADKFEAALKRKVYNTPKSYLDMIKLYIEQLKEKRSELQINASRLSNGLSKLKEANLQVASLSIELEKLKPMLAEQSIKVSAALIEVEKDSRIAAEKEAIVEEEALKVQQQTDRIQLISDEAQQELSLALPELEKASEAVSNIDRTALVNVRGMPTPPALVVLVFEAVCILLGAKNTDWATAKSLMQDLNSFINQLKTYDKDNIPADRIRKLKKVLDKPDFNVEQIRQRVSFAADLATFCRAMKTYYEVNLKVGPKKEQVAKLTAELNDAKEILNKKLTELNRVKSNVQQLRDETNTKLKEKEDLEYKMELTNKRMINAKKLITLTADEAARWKITVEALGGEIENLFGDVFLATASISYNGPFTGIYRNELVSRWTEQVKERNIPSAENYSLVKTLGDPMVMREWVIQGLPSDAVSQENSIFVFKGYRWPLLIDPQLQANKWIKNLEKSNNLSVTKFSNENFIRIFQSAIPNGYPVLIEDVDTTLDPALDTVLSKAFFEADGRTLIQFADKDIDYNKSFRLYLTTKKPNPNYLPEIFIKVTVINFTATFEGLEDQFLADVVKNERPDIEQQRDENVLKLANFRKRIIESEKNILRLLADAKAEKILDDEVLISTLEMAKVTAVEIQEKIAESTILEEQIDLVRNSYRRVSVRGSILFFVIKDLSLIDPMYQYSLQYIARLFNFAMTQAEESKEHTQRLANLIDSITKIIYTNVTRGLFEAHKRIFSFLINISINKNAGIVKEALLSMLLRGAGVFDKAKQPQNPDKSMITVLNWDLAYFIDLHFENFKGLCTSIKTKLSSWKEYSLCADPLKEKLPEEWNDKLDPFEKMIIIKIFRPEKILFAVQDYVLHYIGNFYLESPNISMEKIYNDSDKKTPIIFVLSTGADPILSILNFAKQRGMDEKFQIISLGQGQGEKAAKLIQKGKETGLWVCLQNCHLARTWMSDLEVIVEKFEDDLPSINPDFRLFLTSMPAPYFPVSILQNGIKLTTEPPRGLRANLKRSWGLIDDELLDSCTKREAFHRLTWGVIYFHAIIQERRKFGPLGWNIRYEFNDSDLDTSLKVMKKLLEEGSIIPWDALLFVTGHINYGGRVTDDWDRRCLITILKKFFIEKVLENKNFQFSDSQTYYIPQVSPIEKYRNFIDTLPLNEDPAVFGLHENASITYQQQESDLIISTILSIQPRVGGGGGGKSQDETVIDLITSLQKDTPENLNQSDGNQELFETNESGLIPSLSTVLIQEMERFNTLLNKIRIILKNLKLAIDGMMVMSQELDSTYQSLINNQVPNEWVKVAYPSLKPLASWIADLKERVQTMQKWLLDGNPSVYWISGFFFPQGFMTGVLQTHARKYETPIDKLQFQFKILDLDRENATVKPQDGVYICGLFIEGAVWDRKKKTISDAPPALMYFSMPVIQFIPTDSYSPKIEDYQCPVYKTSVRAGVLSTTGQSTNFVLPVDMPSTDQHPDFWILRGTALLCQLNE